MKWSYSSPLCRVYGVEGSGVLCASVVGVGFGVQVNKDYNSTVVGITD